MAQPLRVVVLKPRKFMAEVTCGALSLGVHANSTVPYVRQLSATDGRLNGVTLPRVGTNLPPTAAPPLVAQLHATSGIE